MRACVRACVRARLFVRFSDFMSFRKVFVFSFPTTFSEKTSPSVCALHIIEPWTIKERSKINQNPSSPSSSMRGSSTRAQSLT